ncbi:MAG: hypothetical protein QM831_11305 [Kofleriaceae bacterium]
MLKVALLAGAFLTGCIIQEDHTGGGGECIADQNYTVSTGATFSYDPGVDAGVYMEYTSGGHWHFEWTCDTQLSEQGCEFTGSITGPISTASCFQCEAEDGFGVANNEVTFDTITTSGVDGVDLDAAPGATLTLALTVDGYDGGYLVQIPTSRGDEVPTCSPVDLTPDLP